MHVYVRHGSGGLSAGSRRQDPPGGCCAAARLQPFCCSLSRASRHLDSVAVQGGVDGPQGVQADAKAIRDLWGRAGRLGFSWASYNGPSCEAAKRAFQTPLQAWPTHRHSTTAYPPTLPRPQNN